MRASTPLPRAAALLAAFLLGAPTAALHAQPGPDALRHDLESAIAASGAEVVGVYYRALAPGGDSVTVDADVRMHAASTMKVPVMMRLFLDAQEGRRSLDSTMVVTTRFRSIVDGSPYDLPASSGSDAELYQVEGQAVTARHLIDRMITRSSNLATNLLIAEADPERIRTLMDRIGADSMDVLRGVEDLKAFRAGLSNTTTARSLGAVMAAVAAGELFTPESRAGMLAILEEQEFTENIPAGLPEGTRVANKTGWITGIHHDAAVVFPDDAPAYVLVLMVRGHPDEDQGTALMQALSRRVWAFHAARAGGGGGDAGGR